MLPHRIRLRGPWQVAGARQPETTVSLRHGIPPLNLRGEIEWVRTFGKPLRLEPHERIWLCLDRPEAPSVVQLNGKELGSTTPGELWEMEVTSLVGEHNRLRIVQQTPPHGWHETALEIRAVAFVTRVQEVWLPDETSRFVEGIIRGPAGISLDLYLLARRSVLAHQQVHLSGDTTSFRISLPPDWDKPKCSSGELRIELMSGASVWHSASIANNSGSGAWADPSAS